MASDGSIGWRTAVLSYGFRPFFLAGAIQAALAIVVWLLVFFGDLQIPTGFSPLDWHVHEMLFGYLPAIIAGFLLTAIPNWTGRPPIRGLPLAVLVLVWLSGRVAVFLSQPLGPVLTGGIDCLFLVLVAAAAAREVILSGNWKNLPPVGLLAILAVANAIFHIEDDRFGVSEFGKRSGIATAILLVALIGGRVIPAFTRNWLIREKPGRLPAPFGRFDAGVLAVSALTLALWIVLPDQPVTAWLLLLAGAGQAVRLARWCGGRTLRSPLTLVLHVGYAFVPAGFVLLAAAVLFPADVPVSAGIHAWTAGAIGVMTLAMMTRVSLGHTGRALSAGFVTCVIYVCAAAAALVRIWAVAAPEWTTVLLLTAGGAWVMAFLLFAFEYGPLLVLPKD
nr:NnrS family protein [uncultured Rhodopila sp.]